MTKRRKVILIALLSAACLCAGLMLVFARGNAPVTYAEEQCLHDYSVFVRTVAPTCEGDGYDIVRCSICGETTNYYHTDDGDYEEYKALGHDWDEVANTIVVEPTCTESGVTYHYCTRCGKSYTEKPTNATGHVFDDTTFDPDCVTGGYTEHYCRKCGYSYTDEETDPVGHKYIRTITPATCTAGGRTYFECSVCKDNYVGDYTDALGHDYVDDVVESGCEAYGYTVHTCSRCGDSYTDSVTAPYGHLFNGISQVLATDSSYGYVKLSCSVCGFVYITNIVTPGGEDEEHDFVLTKVPADCYGGGYWIYECTNCGAYVICNETDPLEHEWELKYVEPTCTEDGGWYWVCVNCPDEYLETREEATGHNLYVSASVEATCTEKGYTVVSCHGCDYTYTTETPATGHVYEVGNVTVSTDKILSLTYTCRGCSLSAISRLYAVFTDVDGNAYTYSFDSNGVADFSALPEGFYTASVYDAVTGEAVFMFVTGEEATSSDGDASQEDEENAGGDEHTHVYVPTVALNASEKTVTVSYRCSCGDDLTDGLVVTFAESGGTTTTYTADASGKVSFTDLGPGFYTGYVYYDGVRVASFPLTIEGGETSGETSGDTDDDEGTSGETSGGDDEGETSGGTDIGDTETSGDTGDEDAGNTSRDADAGGNPSLGADDDAEDYADDEATSDAAETPVVYDDGEKKSNNTTVIVLLVVFVVFVGAIIAVWIVFRRRGKKKAADTQNSDADSVSDAAPSEDDDDE